ncbi:MAG: endolytic transglycosylase MltG [bacterium]
MNRQPFIDKRVYLSILSLFLVVYIFAANPPRNFPSGTMVSVVEGSGLQELALKLEEDEVIRSPFWFRTVAIILGGERAMQAGQYYLPYPQSTFTLAWRVVRGKYGIENKRVTIPEGYTIEKISKLFDEHFQSFDTQEFLVKAREGYLFPDTYFIPMNATAGDVISIMENNFSRQTAELKSEIDTSGRTLGEIVNMAAIIEKEASGESDRSIISGILWKRLANDIALQVDVAPITYERKGLPDEPIANPGILAIKAALHPESSPYLYYLHDKLGNTYYAKTFEEHKINKQKYLN